MWATSSRSRGTTSTDDSSGCKGTRCSSRWATTRSASTRRTTPSRWACTRCELIPKNIENFRRQLKRTGLMIDWRSELSTTDPTYYKWTQWVFLQLYKRGLAYKKRAAVNWCPNDKTVLANEQVIAGECERCGTKVEQRFLEQWFFRITDYAGRLLEQSRSTRLVGVHQGGAAQLDRPVTRGRRSFSAWRTTTRSPARPRSSARAR